MSEQIEMPEDTLLPRGVGPQLRLAREKAGLSVEDVAERTRIAQRYINAIEEGEFGKLSGRSHAVGFARNIAREVGLDENDIVAMVRAEMDAAAPAERERRDSYEPGDPARAPSGRLVWLSILGVLILLAGLFTAYRVSLSPAAELPSLVEQQEAEEAEAAAAAAAAEAEAGTQSAEPSPAGAVVFTATAPNVWVRFYDAAGRRLMERELAEGESYTVPADVDGPQLWTGRPDALRITVGGQLIPPLASEMVTMRDVPVDAASLLAREIPVNTASAPLSQL
ncbi:helix-turn-helix domain-containing protein [Alteraurantiacibacter aquimixticola]|uniref:Helix-turn-helix domain-containing protein n=1 Tax=Alteraurantiacibacter aquimixticola TaxID=2489173 RepID=A0A4T3F6B7_9SPHN|nr:helix-turn-helix domain-containing protein [Alteraurantiacibacter aquimixticola]TIX51202.1 helix-turn-helix domain-containing protein [Alteraurantiacibacter aquimixticola]